MIFFLKVLIRKFQILICNRLFKFMYYILNMVGKLVLLCQGFQNVYGTVGTLLSAGGSAEHGVVSCCAG